MVQEGGIPRLLEMLASNDDPTKEQALLALRNFSTSPDNASKIVRERGLSVLVNCLRSNNDKVEKERRGEERWREEREECSS